MEKTFTVVKRSGKREPEDRAKIQRQIQFACEGIPHVSESMVDLNMRLEMFDGITTVMIDEIILRSMRNLILTEEGHVNYQLAAGRHLNSMLRKQVYGQYDPPPLLDIIKKNIEGGFYTPEILDWYTEEEINLMGLFIDHKKDESLTDAAIEQFRSKYLIGDKSTGAIHETPQVRYMVAAAVNMHAEAPDQRMSYVFDLYKDWSGGETSTATPVIAGLGTKTKQFSSCVKITVDDDLDSIFAAGEMMARYAAKRAGIGFEAGRIRGNGQPIRGGEMSHTGMIPFIHKWFRDLRSVSQGGIRNASATMFFPVWHYDFEELVVLKNNKGTEETRERRLDYAFLTTDYFWRRFKNDQPITLFCPKSAVGLYDAYYSDQEEFIRLYELYEGDPKVAQRSLPADKVMGQLMRERGETNRVYLGFVQNWARGPIDVKKHPIVMSNLCMEILIPSRPFKRIEDENGRIALCTLASKNWSKFKNPKKMEKSVKLSVRQLNNVLEYQDFLSPQSANSNTDFRPLGIGITGLAHWHAQRDMKYGTPEALAEVKRWAEHQYFYALQASVQLAKERGPCDLWQDTIYAKGKFLWEQRAPGVNELTDFTPDPTLDWEGLRADMQKYGVRNALLGAVAPVESSSQLIPGGCTNGVSIPRALVSTKESKVTLTTVVPEHGKLKNKYQLMFDTPVIDYLKTVAVLQVYTCQSISADTWYDPSNYPDGKIDATQIASDLMWFQYWGGKTVYYNILKKDGARKQLEEYVEGVTAPATPVESEEDEEDCVACKL